MGETSAYKPLNAQGFWSVLFTVSENSSGWISLKTISQAITPANGTIPHVDFRLLFVSEANEAVFALSPDHRGVGPEELAASIEAHQALRFREFGQGVLN